MNTAVIKTFDNYFSANIILTRLQSEGIRCYLFDENTVTIGPFFSPAIGWIKLVVDKRDEKIARLALMRYEQEYSSSIQCPECFENDFQIISKPETGNVITAFFVRLFNFTTTIYQCRQCGYETETLPESQATYN